MGLFYFYGVSVGEGRMNGYIKSGELIDGFRESWFPQYQRERVVNKKKINSLINIFKEGKPLDSVKINFIGKHELYDAEAILDGKLHFIDGQQRMRALVDSAVREYRLGVELYLGLSYEDEVKLFHQFNRDGTKLKFGDLVKSSQGLYPDILRRMLKKKDTPVPITINSGHNGIHLAVICPILWLTHKRMVDGLITEHFQFGNRLIDLLAKYEDGKQAMLVEFALNNMLAAYADIFGSFDNKASSYKRAFFMPCMHMFISLFLQSDGKLDFGKFKTKIYDMPSLPNKSRVKELLTRGDSTGMVEMYNIFVDHLNHKLKGGHLPTFKHIKLEKEMVEKGMLERNETFHGKAL